MLLSGVWFIWAVGWNLLLEERKPKESSVPHSTDAGIVVFHPAPSQKGSDSVTERTFVLQSRVPEDGMTLLFSSVLIHLVLSFLAVGMQPRNPSSWSQLLWCDHLTLQIWKLDSRPIEKYDMRNNHMSGRIKDPWRFLHCHPPTAPLVSRLEPNPNSTSTSS